MIKIDPKNKNYYTKNAQNYIKKIDLLIEPIKKIFANIPIEERWLVTSEGAFSYLARDFKLKELYLWPMNSDSQGTPSQVKNVIDNIRKYKIGVIFSESTVSPKPAIQIAKETGILYGGILFVDSLSDKNGPVPTYLDLIRVTSERIAKNLKRSIEKKLNDIKSNILKISGVDVIYNNEVLALKNVTFDLSKSTIAALVGMNGSGKSTLFKAIMGFTPMTKGSIKIFGLEIKNALKKNLIAYVPQNEEIDWDFPILVEDVVMMGRYGFMNFLKTKGPRFKNC